MNPLHRHIERLLSQSGFPSEKKVLEIGCGTGTNLAPFIAAGWGAFGVEPNPHLANLATRKGITVHEGFVDSAAWRNDQYDFIILNHVLEHDYEPRRILKVCASCLKKGGLLYVEIPILESPSWRIFGPYAGSLDFPVHLTLLRGDQLVGLLGDLGFHCLESERKTLYGDSLRTLLSKHPSFKNTSTPRKMGLLAIATGVQATMAGLDKILGRGEAFSVLATR